MSHHDNRAVVEQMMAAMQAGDIPAATANLADDAVVEWPQSGERIVGRDACKTVYLNYPGGPPSYEVRRITGEGDHFTVEAVGDYGGQKTLTVMLVELRDGKVVRQTDYWSDPFEAPAWRAQWVERMEPV